MPKQTQRVYVTTRLYRVGIFRYLGCKRTLILTLCYIWNDFTSQEVSSLSERCDTLGKVTCRLRTNSTYSALRWTDREVVEFQRAALDCLSPGSPLPLLQLLIQDTSLDTWLRVPQPLYINVLSEMKGVFLQGV